MSEENNYNNSYHCKETKDLVPSFLSRIKDLDSFYSQFLLTLCFYITLLTFLYKFH